MTTFDTLVRKLCEVNGLEGDSSRTEWFFYNGMLFGSRAKWWGDWKVRSTQHEGIDICWYRVKGQSGIQCFTPETKVPSICDGTVLNICDDFLSRTVVVEHARDSASRVIFTYAHIVPEKSIKKGNRVSRGDIIARVSHTHRNPQLPPHLHFSCFEISMDVPPEEMNWNLFTDPDRVNMIHPVFL